MMSFSISSCTLHFLNFIYAPICCCFSNDDKWRKFLIRYCNFVWCLVFFIISVIFGIIAIIVIYATGFSLSVWFFLLICYSLNAVYCWLCGGWVSIWHTFSNSSESFPVGASGALLGLCCSLMCLIITAAFALIMSVVGGDASVIIPCFAFLICIILEICMVIRGSVELKMAYTSSSISDLLNPEEIIGGNRVNHDLRLPPPPGIIIPRNQMQV